MPVLCSTNPFASVRDPNHPHHLLVAVDKFTKWIEVKPITNIRLEEAVKFYLDIIYRFGVPNYIITDHGTNFTGKKFLDFSEGYGIRIDWMLDPLLTGRTDAASGERSLFGFGN